jgi:class 3 adenylate cyclase
VGATATVTLLFCDLAGSTELLSRVGDEAGDDVRHGWMAALRDAVTANRGTEVKNLGDGLMVAFGSAADAVGCAIAMQRALYGLSRRLGLALSLRVGISAGEVSTEEGDYFGTPVVEAARLCAAAAPGQVLAADVVRALVGSRSPAPLIDVGRFALKGLSGPTAAVSVEWAQTPDHLLPMPPVLASSDRHEFIGRAAELEQLAGELEAAGDGRIRLVLIPGEPGIGKTTLTAELARRAHTKGFIVLWGRCDEEALVPYQPFVEALEHWAIAARRAELDAVPETVAAELARVVPRLAVRRPGLPAVPRDDAESQRYRLFEAVAELFDEMANVAPVLLVLDDLHWADGASLLLLRHLVRRPRTGAVTVVATYRDTDVGRTHPLASVLADLRREGQSARVPLRGLGEEEVEAVLAAGGIETGGDGHALTRSLYRATEGNPLFVHETLRHLQESGALSSAGRGWQATMPIERLGIPEGIKDVFGRRLSRLSPEADELLGLAAVVGRVFDLDVLARVSEADEDALVDRLEEASRAGLVHEVPPSAGRVQLLPPARPRDDLRRDQCHPAGATAPEDRPGSRGPVGWGAGATAGRARVPLLQRRRGGRSGQGGDLRTERGRTGARRAGLRGGRPPLSHGPRRRRARRHAR